MNIHDVEYPENDFDGMDSSENSTGGFGKTRGYDPQQIRISTKSFSLREIVTQINEGETDLSPDFQREFVWKPRQVTRLVESALLGIPLPAFYFNQDKDGMYQVIDGVQRLTAVKQFMSDSHVLKKEDLEHLKDLDNLMFSQLGVVFRRQFCAVQIVAHVIEPLTPDEIKFDIFNRVNTLGSPLSAQEIRHAMSGSRSREFLGTLVEDERFDKATEYHFWNRNEKRELVRDNKRMTDRELALRFCAFLHFDIDEYRKFDNLDAFLMNFIKRIDNVNGLAGINDRDLAYLQNSFGNAMESAEKVLGLAAFRRWLPDADRRGPINKAVFEAQAIALAGYSGDDLMSNREDIADAFRNAFNDDDYNRSVTVGTGNPLQVAFRLNETTSMLDRSIAPCSPASSIPSP